MLNWHSYISSGYGMQIDSDRFVHDLVDLMQKILDTVAADENVKSLLSKTPPHCTLSKAKEAYTIFADPANKHLADNLAEASGLFQAVRRLEALMPGTFEMATLGDVCVMLRLPGMVATSSKKQGAPRGLVAEGPTAST